MLIKPINEVVREQMEAAVNAALEKYRDAVRPIYGTDRKEKPAHAGSCFILEYKKEKFLVTAAHVIDDTKITQLYIGGFRNLVPIEGDFNITEAPDGCLDKDHYDFAWSRISSEIYNQLGKVGCILESDISPNKALPNGRVYLAMGFPRSKNKKADPTNSTLRPKRWRYYSTWKEMPELYSQLGLSGQDHISIDHKYRSTDENGFTVNSFRPRGMSGGPLIDLGKMSDPSDYSRKKPFPGLLAGVLIEKHDDLNAMLSVKINLVLEDIRRSLAQP